MAKQQHPDERSTRRPSEMPDHARPQPTGDEVFDPAHAGSPPRETDRVYEADFHGGRHGSDDDARQAAAGSYARLTAAADDLTVQARQVFGSSQAFVRSHPASTLAGAVAVGVVIGLLIGRD